MKKKIGGEGDINTLKKIDSASSEWSFCYPHAKKYCWRLSSLTVIEKIVAGHIPYEMWLTMKKCVWLTV